MTHAHACPCPECVREVVALGWLPITADGLRFSKAEASFPFEELEQRAIRAFGERVSRELKEEMRRLTRGLDPKTTLSDRQTRDLLAKLKDSVATMQAAVAAAATPYATMIAEAGAVAGLGQLPDGSYDFKATEGRYSDDVARAARRASQRMAQSVAQTTADKIGRAIAAGIKENLTGRELAQLLTTDTGIGIDRATMIARTESARAFTDGQIEAWKATGVVSGKRWLVSPYACAFCEEAGRLFGANAIGLHDNFFEQGASLSVGGKSMALDFDSTSGPPLHPNCRCTIIPMLTEAT